MPPIFLAVMAMGFFGGLLLLWLGLRGRKLNNHPVCRQCRFDLEGVYPESVTCPECGAGLKRENSVRIGVRRRYPALVVVGAVLAMMPVVPLGVIGYAALTGSDVRAYLPVGVLLWEARHGTQASAAKIADELTRRAQNKTLSGSGYSSAIETALAMQADPAAPWSEAWGNFIGNAKLDGTLARAADARFEENSALLKLETRDTTAAGVKLPVTIALDQARVGSGDVYSHTLTLVGAKVDGKDVEAKPGESEGGGLGGLGGWSGRGMIRMTINGVQVQPDGSDGEAGVLGQVNAAGSRVPLNVFGTGAQEVRAVVTLPGDLAPGEHTLELRLERDVTAGRVGFAMPMLGGAAGGTPVTLKTKVRIAPVEELVEAVPPDAGLTTRLASKLRPGAIVLEPGGGDGTPTRAEVTFPLREARDLDVPLACDVILRSGTREWKIGELSSVEDGAGAGNANVRSSFSSIVIINGKQIRSSSGGGDDRTVSGKAPGFDAARADIVLRPRATVALGNNEQKKYYNDEIVIPDVPVETFRDPFGGFRDPMFRDMQKRQDEMMRRLQQRMRGGP